jgi:hypothetical protein
MKLEKEQIKEIKELIERYLNGYPINATEVNNGMTYIDSDEANSIANNISYRL